MVKIIREEIRKLSRNPPGGRILTIPRDWAKYFEFSRGEDLRTVKVIWGTIVVVLYPDADEALVDRVKRFLAEVSE